MSDTTQVQAAAEVRGDVVFTPWATLHDEPIRTNVKLGNFESDVVHDAEGRGIANRLGTVRKSRFDGVYIIASGERGGQYTFTPRG